MDYLDPEKKRAHRNRLMIGYALMAIAIGLATVILIYLGSGYYIDRKNGGIIQNGMLYIDSKPESARITLNGKLQKSPTDARLVVPSGNYAISLARDGYREWRRTIELEGGQVLRLAYPRLVPTDLKTDVAQTFAEQPDLVTQSPNRQFMILRLASSPLNFLLLESDDVSNVPKELALPNTVLGDPARIGTFEAIEWADNDRHLLLKHNFAGGYEYILFDREQPNESLNLTRQLALPATTTVKLRDDSADRFVVYDAAAQTVIYAERSQTALTTPVLTNVLAVEDFEQDFLLYVTPSATLTDKVEIKLAEKDRSYLIREVPKSDKYLLAISRFSGDLVLAAGSPAEGKAGIYRDPIGYMNSNPERRLPLAKTILRVDAPQQVSFSTSSSVVVLHGQTSFASHEFEVDRSYNFALNSPFDSATPLRWMDGARLNYVSAGEVYSVDFDGSNVEKLIPGKSELGVYYDRDFNNLISFTAGNDGKLFQITRTSLKVQ